MWNVFDCTMHVYVFIALNYICAMNLPKLMQKQIETINSSIAVTRIKRYDRDKCLYMCSKKKMKIKNPVADYTYKFRIK